MAAFDARDTAELLRRLGKAADGVVVVGGQALNAWAELYSERVPELRDEGPFTSRDFDLLGDRHAMRGCAERLGGTCVFPDPFEDHGPNAGALPEEFRLVRYPQMAAALQRVRARLPRPAV